MNEKNQSGILLRVAYDGRYFHGMALQPNHRTVAGELLGALRCLDPSISILRQVSRTDAGVHACDQVVVFDPQRSIAPRGWVLGLHQHLPEEIVVRSAATVEKGFEPRRHVLAKLYRYRILHSPVRDPFLVGRVWRVGDRLNQAWMLSELEALEGIHDFAGFRSASDGRQNSCRTIHSARLVQDPSDGRCFWIEVRGDGFLHHMVRIIVGTVVDVGRARRPRGTVVTALASCRREDSGMTAPPDGLFLAHVELDVTPANGWPDPAALRIDDP